MAAPSIWTYFECKAVLVTTRSREVSNSGLCGVVGGPDVLIEQHCSASTRTSDATSFPLLAAGARIAVRAPPRSRHARAAPRARRDRDARALGCGTRRGASVPPRH